MKGISRVCRSVKDAEVVVDVVKLRVAALKAGRMKRVASILRLRFTSIGLLSW